jgi:hypothetical protein
MMKKLVSSVALLSALGMSAALPAAFAHDRQVQERTQATGERSYWNQDDLGFWNTDNWEEDAYGIFDEDFSWSAEDPGWDNWYGNDATAWNTYDDIGEEGWFDV